MREIDSISSHKLLCLLIISLMPLFWMDRSLGQTHDATTAPWDFRDGTYVDDLAIVNKYHFNLDVQMLRAGQSNQYVGGDLMFILGFFPNHHGALDTMGRLWRRQLPNRSPPGLSFSKDAIYFFEKAVSFAPDDGIVEMLYGMHLFLDGQNDRAMPHVRRAVELEPDSPEIHYNAGLFFVAFGDYQIAMEHAQFAYRNGYPLPGLRQKLVKIGAWNEGED